MTDDEIRDMETMYREFDFFAKLNAKCKHSEPVWLDCECGDPEGWHQFALCPDCGEDAEEA